MCLLLAVVAPMRADTSLLESASGLITTVGDGVGVLLKVDVWSAKMKAARRGSSARSLRALGSANLSHIAPARLQGTPTT